MISRVLSQKSSAGGAGKGSDGPVRAEPLLLGLVPRRAGGGVNGAEGPPGNNRGRAAVRAGAGGIFELCCCAYSLFEGCVDGFDAEDCWLDLQPVNAKQVNAISAQALRGVGRNMGRSSWY